MPQIPDCNTGDRGNQSPGGYRIRPVVARGPSVLGVTGGRRLGRVRPGLPISRRRERATIGSGRGRGLTWASAGVFLTGTVTAPAVSGQWHRSSLRVNIRARVGELDIRPFDREAAGTNIGYKQPRPAGKGHLLLLTTATATAGRAVYQKAGIVFDNNICTPYLREQNPQGPGIAPRVRFHEGSINSGLQVKHSLPRFEDNRLGIRSGLGESLEAFHNDQSAYAPPGSYAARSSIPGEEIPISCTTTTALTGRDDQSYQFDVDVGLKLSGNRPHEPTGPPLKVPLKTPEAGVVPQPDEEVMMPNGTHYKVDDPSSISAE
ncbi:hypothetical protein MYCTH_2125585 [Thermothelomyces thermophilus ATCC 42464]|uniref:Uncharacterized protein n=1 Tax=Thermothelomyces thermophilus (strain ATCC 42464 / BCRC 31852 / DSM 1799) TaxID=573729 RepID=G2Q9Z7_THET4|nr:uncharacterized protein MYCTH_2125585 [Thermothelomyces thermophilus ATCC 42464]AEO56601.1 hypothetical protein MYCTH_2125585 [Thermothelomyces thermophilus ATCC 42464]